MRVRKMFFAFTALDETGDMALRVALKNAGEARFAGINSMSGDSTNRGLWRFAVGGKRQLRAVTGDHVRKLRRRPVSPGTFTELRGRKRCRRRVFRHDMVDKINAVSAEAASVKTLP